MYFKLCIWCVCGASHASHALSKTTLQLMEIVVLLGYCLVLPWVAGVLPGCCRGAAWCCRELPGVAGYLPSHRLSWSVLPGCCRVLPGAAGLPGCRVAGCCRVAGVLPGRCRVRLPVCRGQGSSLVLLLSKVEPHARENRDNREGQGPHLELWIHISIRNQLPSTNHANDYTCGQKIIGREKLTTEM